jgi:hypothetical protein
MADVGLASHIWTLRYSETQPRIFVSYSTVQSFMGLWNIGVNGPNDSGDRIFDQIIPNLL